MGVGNTVMMLLSEAAVHGPAPSGSFVVQMMFTGPPVSPTPGRYVVLVEFAFPKAPLPVVVHCPGPFAATSMLTTTLLQVVYGPLTIDAVAGSLTETCRSSVSAQPLASVTEMV